MSTLTEVKVPDIGTTSPVSVIEVLVKPGDLIKENDSIITLESDKATMEVPSSSAGEVAEVKVKVGDKITQGGVILRMKAEGAPAVAEQIATPATPKKDEQKVEKKIEEPQEVIVPAAAESSEENESIYAGPAVRRLARELGVNLTQISGTGRKGRLQKDDLLNYVKARLASGGGAAGTGLAFPPLPAIDFSQFGSIETKPLSKIKRLTSVSMQRSWITVPHVTQFDEADITELEAFRVTQKAQAEKQGIKLTSLAFVMKAVVKALKQFPQFNASLDAKGEQLIYKHYYHIGIAVDTSQGLVVPVLRDVDQKGVMQIAQEMATISQKARDKKLMPADMAGNSFTISSLGGVGGTAFTPIINLPDVAILGVSRASMKPVYQNNAFVPRLMLPLSLSYDHRVIDGAEAAKFTSYLSHCLTDMRLLLL